MEEKLNEIAKSLGAVHTHTHNQFYKKDENYLVGKRTISETRGNSGITLIALVITIVVLLILARSYNCNAYGAEWNFDKCTKGE